MSTRNLIAPTALAVAMALGAPLAFAADNGISDPMTESVNVTTNKTVTNTKNVAVDGKVKVKGTVRVKSDAEATTKTDQQAINNTTENYNVNDNYARINGNAGSGAMGNIQINVTAGDNNVQSNNAALAALDKTDVFGRLDAETYVDQLTTGNRVTNQAKPGGGQNGPITNIASINGNALMNAQGNINVNDSAGTNNLQANSLAAAVGNASLASASAISFQQTGDTNSVSNTYMHNTAALGGNALKGAQGNISVNIAAGDNNAQSNSLAITASLK
jgi:hypothetical protein